MAVHTRGQLLAGMVTTANDEQRGQDRAVAEQNRGAAGDSIATACVDKCHTGGQPAGDARSHGLMLEVNKFPTFCDPTWGVVWQPVTVQSVIGCAQTVCNAT